MLGGAARARAARLLDDVIEAFRPLGYHEAERPAPREVRLERKGALPLTLRFDERGKVFGGSVALEVTTAQPVLPSTPRGLSARARGAVKQKGVAFRARGDDAAAEALAASLGSDARLSERLNEVHFERVRVDPDGRPVIRHMGGSVVWTLFPPLVRQVPLVPEQAKATVEALQAFAQSPVGQHASRAQH